MQTNLAESINNNIIKGYAWFIVSRAAVVGVIYFFVLFCYMYPSLNYFRRLSALNMESIFSHRLKQQSMQSAFLLHMEQVNERIS